MENGTFVSLVKAVENIFTEQKEQDMEGCQPRNDSIKKLSRKCKPSKRHEDKMSVTSVSADGQTSISGLSRSTFHSKGSSSTNQSFLIDTRIFREKRLPLRNSSKGKERKDYFKSPCRIDRMFLELYDLVIESGACTISCANEEVTLQNPSTTEEIVFVESNSDIPPIITKATGKQETDKHLEGDGSQSDSNKAMFLSYEKNIPAVGKETVEIKEGIGASKYDVMHFQSTDESDVPYVSYKALRGVPTIPTFLTFAASRYQSSSLSVGDLSSSIAFIASDDKGEGLQGAFDLIEKSNTDVEKTTEATENTSLDSFSFSTPVDACASAFQIVDGPLEQNIENIEIDETGMILNGNEKCVYPEDKDIYLSYKFNANEPKSDGETSMSSSQGSNTSNTSVVTPKELPGSKTFSISKLRKLKMFSRSKRKNDLPTLHTKVRKSVCDSPITVATEGTNKSEESSFGDISLNRDVPYAIRPRTTLGY